MMLIFGLGNPERDYKGTRHNVGFEVINKLSYDFGININKAKFRAHLGEGRIKGEKVILLKPQTYMNLSGECVRDALNFYKLAPEDIIVILDDADLMPGRIRIRERGSAGGHNGMKNIIYHLESDEFIRVRIGIGRPNGREMINFVTGKFAKSEMDDIISGITLAGDAVEMILTDGVQAAMNKFNASKNNSKESTDLERND